MAKHGDFVSDTSKLIRFSRDEEGGLVRVMLREDYYRYIKPLYDKLELIFGNAGLEEVPDPVDPVLEWLYSFSYDVSAYEWGFKFAIIAYVFHLIKSGTSLGKFTYEEVDELGTFPLVFSLDGGGKLVEYPTPD